MAEGRCYDNSNGTNDMSLREALQHVSKSDQRYISELTFS